MTEAQKEEWGRVQNVTHTKKDASYGSRLGEQTRIAFLLLGGGVGGSVRSVTTTPPNDHAISAHASSPLEQRRLGSSRLSSSPSRRGRTLPTGPYHLCARGRRARRSHSASAAWGAGTRRGFARFVEATRGCTWSTIEVPWGYYAYYTSEGNYTQRLASRRASGTDALPLAQCARGAWTTYRVGPLSGDGGFDFHEYLLPLVMSGHRPRRRYWVSVEWYAHGRGNRRASGVASHPCAPHASRVALGKGGARSPGRLQLSGQPSACALDGVADALAGRGTRLSWCEPTCSTCTATASARNHRAGWRA